MVIYQRKILLRETDATGFLYFPQIFNLAMEALEKAFSEWGLSVKKLIEEEEFHLPIVHSAADFLAPIKVGDEVDIALFIERMGTSSFTTRFEFYKEKELVAKVTLIQVAVSKITTKSIPLTESLLREFSGFEGSGRKI